MPTQSNAPVRQKRKEKDEHEWTTPEQKAHLCAKQGEYEINRECKTLPAWFNVELAIYFVKFPVKKVTKQELDVHGPEWTFDDKKNLEILVSI